MTSSDYFDKKCNDFENAATYNYARSVLDVKQQQEQASPNASSPTLRPVANPAAESNGPTETANLKNVIGSITDKYSHMEVKMNLIEKQQAKVI
ncbi:unnamed protein product [Didymodactylos carnosus]|uniref:Uncharacterized protein n=1 Tax=Didymodactylos carnosus TaxID=1234261 RepID=A0A815BYX8_9BILA|nr:unnamed protein product [Didymodactylos carnosus]CAF1279937.1 unnamed protein product [Didymodactylos carnosus]CAF3791595.1 unnamed protein product [Didymodactylos carnosus]CAF4074502.1 unnamed protein product [Didymodactylos carnosus]